nr:MAG TPA: hypothetical protein [Caudoviricetes sp.]
MLCIDKLNLLIYNMNIIINKEVIRMNYIIKVDNKYYMGKEFGTNNIVLNENVVHAQRFTNYKEVKELVSELELIKGSKIKIIKL